VSGDRTEQPTPKRLREARRRGEVAQSRELTGAAALVGGLGGLAAVAPDAARELARLLASSLGSATAGTTDPLAALHGGAAIVLRLTLAPALAALVAGVLSATLQSGFAFSPEALRPRAERLDPVRGLRRLVSPSHLAAVALGVVKAAVLVATACLWLASAARALAGLARLEPRAIWAALPLLRNLAVRLVAVFVLFALVDYALARRRHLRALRMSKDEVRREHKEDEGDPSHRAERRRLHRALLDAGPIARATVVVVNPTHVAVALRHERGADGAPRLVAKGTGLAAARIRSAARRAGVPIVRDVPLARALHRLAEVGDEIPEQLYDAAAALIAQLYGLEEVP
jgi:type III secretion protein U